MADQGGPTPMVQPPKASVSITKPVVALVKCHSAGCSTPELTPDAATKEGWYKGPEGKRVCRQHNEHIHRKG